MREKVVRLLGLVQAGRLTLDDAAPLLAALSPKLALEGSDRELLASLLARENLSAEQLAEHLLLLRGLRDPSPRTPQPGRGRPGGREAITDRTAELVGRTLDSAADSPQQHLNWGELRPQPGPSARVLSVHTESSDGSEYHAHFPLSLAPHLHKLIPPHGVRALEAAGFSLEALQLLIEADPPPGDLVTAEDSAGNEIQISIR